MDAFFVGIVLLFFGLTWGVVKLSEKLQEA
jgi:putative effector of murein hydrolase LrgA (UPF0299 family)